MIKNPILRGFRPDPSIIRVKDDYYIATSTFEWWPGVKIHHSKDLKSWKQIKSPLSRMEQLNMVGNPTSGGVWAPCLTYDNGIFYLVFTDVKTKKDRYYNTHNYLVYTDDIEKGEWSDPVYLNSTGFDPSLFHDLDGKKYVVNMINGFKGILVQEYDAVNHKLVGPCENVFLGTEAGYTEGPHIYHIGDWYYLMVAEGGTGYGHCITMARSKSVWGPYEVDPENPMLRAAETETYLQRCGHGDIVETQNGEWYLVHLCSRPRKDEKYSLLGRETAIQKVAWNEEGWLRLTHGDWNAAVEVEELDGKTEEVVDAENENVVFRDSFAHEELSLRYVFPRLPLGEHGQVIDGRFRLYGQESLSSLHRVSLAAIPQTEVSVCVQIGMEFEPECPEQVAGLSYMYDAMNFYIFGKTKDAAGNSCLQLIKSDTGVIKDVIEPIPVKEGELYFRINTNENGKWAEFAYSYDCSVWNVIPVLCDTDILTDEHCRGFTGAHFGMYCHDMTGFKKYAEFKKFSYEVL